MCRRHSESGNQELFLFLHLFSWFHGFRIAVLVLNYAPMADDRCWAARLGGGKSEHHTAACRVKYAGNIREKRALTESVTEKTPPVL